jgi:hypothetical protein
MKKAVFLLIVLAMMGWTLTTTAVAASTVTTTPTPEFGQLKICKVAGTGVTQGQLFTFKVGGNTFYVPAGPADNGYCVLAGQYPLTTELTIEEVIPAGYYVSRIEVKPDRVVSRGAANGKVVIRIGSGVTEAIFTNKLAGLPTPTRTPTSVNTSTPKPTNTPTQTPGCSPNCTPTPTPIPKGRLQICKEADGEGVNGYFTFKFETRSRSVPVGACAGLISVNAGSLTITEVKQTGFELTDVYTIPANRLISKKLSGGSVVVTIVEGTSSSQTIVVFRNRSVISTNTPTFTSTFTATSTPTPISTGTITATSTFTTTPTPASTGSITPTFTSTPTSTGTITATSTFTTTPTPTSTGTITATPPACPPVIIVGDFSRLSAGQSVEGLGVVAPYLNIDAKGTAVSILQDIPPFVYAAPNNASMVGNNGVAANGGFSDFDTKNALQAHLYAFTFMPGVSVSNFSLHMLDYGDFNPTNNPSHLVTMTAFSVSGQVAQQRLEFTSIGNDSPQFGNLAITGDAIDAVPGQPGNWTWHVSGSGIIRVVLEFGAGYDPNIAFDTLSFTTECP